MVHVRSAIARGLDVALGPDVIFDRDPDGGSSLVEALRQLFRLQD